MQAFLASRIVDQISDYNERGRSYRALSDDELVLSWQSIWKELATDPISTKKLDTQADLASEFALRQKNPPWEIVRRQINIFQKATKRAWERQRLEDPEANAQSNKDIENDLEEFLNRRNRSH